MIPAVVSGLDGKTMESVEGVDSLGIVYLVLKSTYGIKKQESN